jgi:hypothetical protein
VGHGTDGEEVRKVARKSKEEAAKGLDEDTSITNARLQAVAATARRRSFMSRDPTANGLTAQLVGPTFWRHAGALAQPTVSYAEFVVPPSALSIEPGPGVTEQLCAHCGRPFSSVRGFLYEQGDPYAVYHALLQTEHPSTVADIALSFGRWDDDATAEDRSRVGLRVWSDGDELKMHITDPSESAWGDSETFGRMLSRSEVLGTDRQYEALQAVEFVIAHDPRLVDHLH